ncbi:MAG: Uma2 family endonuclease [Candidatus Brocadia sp.]|jgi:Uma2 family endonuclease
MTTAVIPGHWTYEDYYNLDDGQRYEVIEGELIVAPAPSFKHQEVITRLVRLISNYVYEKEVGKVVASPVDVVLRKDIVLQPDIIYISHKNMGIVRDAGVFGTPDIIIEVLSPASVYRDMQVKKNIYERFGIQEYWIVFPDEKVIEIFTLDKGRYALISSAEKAGKIVSQVLGMEIDIKDVFQ